MIYDKNVKSAAENWMGDGINIIPKVQPKKYISSPPPHSKIIEGHDFAAWGSTHVS